MQGSNYSDALKAAGLASAAERHDLVAPGTMYGARQNNLDLRVSKILAFGRTRSTVGLDILNVFNSATILSQSSAYATWLAPQSIPQPRAARIGVQVDF